ncbi:hypothetical protein BJ138DRAFT_901601 [Hygrophoropsis aurantiaca]|uniref:Uncharacterized protein n=1 Tax=Hygrophoropsis aurantiaca TaxID=72124 RepID=A0ACB7ZV28_9AGAM|nr:hypothetical protein BJ138DRAFT_901601 [Hygrophoropsis aurantiaca]
MRSTLIHFTSLLGSYLPATLLHQWIGQCSLNIPRTYHKYKGPQKTAIGQVTYSYPILKSTGIEMDHIKAFVIEEHWLLSDSQSVSIFFFPFITHARLVSQQTKTR